jgi:hypothetical protein
LDAGANANVANKLQSTPLHAAVFAGHVPLTEALLGRGADVHAQDRDGMTPLHWAVAQRHFSLIEPLVNAGARLATVDARGVTPLSLTASLGKRTGEKIRLSLVECAKRRDESTSALNLRLADLCRIWSVLKLVHPAVAHRFSDGSALDSALVSCIQRTLEDEVGAAFVGIVASLLAAVGDATTRIVTIESVGTSADNNSSALAAVEAQPAVRFTQDGISVIELTDHRQFADYASKMPAFYARFAEARQKSKAIVFDLRSLHDDSASRDFYVNSETSSYAFKFMFIEAFRSFLTSELVLPTRRSRVYRGAPPAVRGAGASARFAHGLVAWDGDSIPPGEASAAASGSEFVFIVNRRTPRALVDVAVAVQAAGIGKIVYEHDVVSERVGAPFFVDADVAVVVPTSLRQEASEQESLLTRFVALISTSELVAADGSLGFAPDATVSPSRSSATTPQGNFVSGADSQAYRAALGLLRGSVLPVRSTAVRASAHVRTQRETDPCNGQLPTLPYRCLALFRAWHVLRHFYAHNDVLDLDWQRVLVETLPKVRRASTELSFAVCIIDLASKLHDSTASVSCPALTRARGTHGPPLVVRRIGDADVIVDVLTDALTQSAPMRNAAAAADAASNAKGADSGTLTRLSASALELIGCAIVRINGEPTAVVRRRAAMLVAGASSPAALDARVSPLLLAGDHGSPVLVQWRAADGSLQSHTFFRTVPLARCAAQPRATCPAIGVVPATTDAAPNSTTRLVNESGTLSPDAAAAAAADVQGGIAYLDVERAETSEVQRVWPLLAKQKCLVIDARHACRAATHALLISLLASSGDDRGAAGAKSFMPLLFGDEVTSDGSACDAAVGYRTHRFSVGVGALPSGKAVFERGIVLLVDITTSAAAEQACFDLLSVRNDCTLLGMPTAGVCGVASNCTLPGGIMLGFTARGTELAGNTRRGLVPTIAVMPSRDAIAGADDVVIAAALTECRKRIANSSSSGSISGSASGNSGNSVKLAIQ